MLGKCGLSRIHTRCSWEQAVGFYHILTPINTGQTTGVNRITCLYRNTCRAQLDITGKSVTSCGQWGRAVISNYNGNFAEKYLSQKFELKILNHL